MQSEITLKNLGGEHHPGQLRRWTVHSGKMNFFSSQHTFGWVNQIKWEIKIKKIYHIYVVPRFSYDILKHCYRHSYDKWQTLLFEHDPSLSSFSL